MMGGGGWVRRSATMIDQRQKKKKKLHGLKRPKAVTKKQNLDHKINDWKPHIWSLSIEFRFSDRESQS